MLVGYIYTSRAEGEAMLERQRVALNASWVPILRKHEDYTVRRSDARPELEKCLPPEIVRICVSAWARRVIEVLERTARAR